MPKHLLVACIFFIGSVVGLAGLTTVYGTGVSRALSQLAPLSFAAVAVLFMLRQRWTLSCMKGIAAASVLGNSFFFPSERFYGGYTFSAQLLAGVLMVACIVILWSVLRAPDTKAWFASNGVLPAQQAVRRGHAAALRGDPYAEHTCCGVMPLRASEFQR